MRRKSKVDTNQPVIVAALRDFGCSVSHTHTLGRGFPDICFGYRGQTFLAEIKDGSLPPSKRVLTEDEEKWHNSWLGQVAIFESVDDVVKFLREI